MKKIFLSLIVVLLMAGTSFACQEGGCDEGEGFAAGVFATDTDSFGYGLSADGRILPGFSGAAGGIGGAIGFSEAEADGFVFDGDVGGNVNTVGGGFSTTEAYRFSPHIGDVGVGVGSWTETSATTGAHVDVNVNPEQGLGGAAGHISGFTAMGSLNGSIVGPSPRRDWDSDGYSVGVAGQGAFGGFEGDVLVEAGPDVDYWRWQGGFCGGHWVHVQHDSRAGAEAGAQIDMNGYSVSESYRFIDNNRGFHTEGMGTYVEAGTQVTATGYASDYDHGIANANSGVYGGYVAFGGAATQTVQSNDTGAAQANAVSAYVGAGELNTQFNGSASGYSSTSLTTSNNMNGSVASSSAGMQVHSSVSGICVE